MSITGSSTLRFSLAIVLALLVALAAGGGRPASGAPFTVTNANDAGAGSLRQAILDANASAGLDTIDFDPTAFPPGSPATIAVASALPGATDPAGTTIDGTGAGVIIDGSALVGTEDGLSFHTSGGVDLTNVTVRAVTVQNFPHFGIFICGGAPALPCIGDDLSNALVDGVTVSGNGHHGIAITGLSVSDATVTGSTLSNNESHGAEVNSCGGNVTAATLTNNTSTGNASDGLYVNSCDDVIGATLTGNTATGNGDDGLYLNAGDNVTDATVTDNTATGNDDEGIYLNAGMNNTGAAVSNNTSDGNSDDGVHLNAGGNLTDTTVAGNLIPGNSEDGVYLNAGTVAPTDMRQVNGNIICGNVASGFNAPDTLAQDAEGNWWGHASGPTHPANPTGIGDAIIGGGADDVDFDPWVDTITGSAGAATVGQPVVVTFQFTGGSGGVALQQGPGDPNGSPPFSATTDNGAVTTTGFVDSGKLEVTLTPDTVGEATVTVTGPCGLDETTGGNSVTLDVAAAPVGATPTPTSEATPTPTATPAELPTTGGEPGSGGGAPTLAIVVLAAGAAALAGVGGGLVAVRRRR
jgi:hypothetical protein